MICVVACFSFDVGIWGGTGRETGAAARGEVDTGAEGTRAEIHVFTCDRNDGLDSFLAKGDSGVTAGVGANAVICTGAGVGVGVGVGVGAEAMICVVCFSFDVGVWGGTGRETAAAISGGSEGTPSSSIETDFGVTATVRTGGVSCDEGRGASSLLAEVDSADSADAGGMSSTVGVGTDAAICTGAVGAV